MSDQYEDDFAFDNDLSNVDENAGGEFEPMPAGRYRMQAISVELKDSMNAGKMVNVTLMVTEGQFANRRIFETFCLQHPKETPRRIAEQQVKQWLIACGYTGTERITMSLLRSLEGIEFDAHVYIEKSKDPQYQDRNRIRKYEKSGAAAPAATRPTPAPVARPNPTPAAAPSSPPPAQRAATAAGGKRPWERQ